jgi:hypothetical protein
MLTGQQVADYQAYPAIAITLQNSVQLVWVWAALVL